MLDSSPAVNSHAAPVAEAPVKKTIWQKLRSEKFSRNITWFLMGLPALGFVLLLKYFPMFGIVLAFQDYKVKDGFLSEWVGLKNFEFLFRTPQIWTALRNTLIYNLIFIVVGLVAALFLAFLIYEIYTSLATRFYQTVLFFPNFISWVIVSYFVFTFLNFQDGLLNKILIYFGQDPVRWYSSPQYWPVILVFLVIWKGAGGSSLIYLAAMLGIDPQYFEAARIDGANKWQEFRYIIFPLLMPLIIINVLISIGYIFGSDFGLFYIATRVQGNPAIMSAVDTMDTFVYRSLIRLSNVGMSSAAGLFQSVAGFILVMVSNWIVRKIDPERSLF